MSFHSPVAVSVLMPLYNAESYVREAVQSILQETRVGLELIVIDDSSTDRSPEVLKSIRDDRLVVLQSQGKGIVAALNTGIGAARGAFIARCDSDDRYPAGRLFQQVNWLMQHPEAGAVCGGYQAIDSSGTRVTVFEEHQQAEEITSELQSGTTRTHLCTFLIRSDIVRAVGGFRPYFITAEDIDFQLRLGERTSVWYLPGVYYDYRIHQTSITHTKSLSSCEFFDQIAREFQQQRQQTGKDALQQGCPPEPPPGQGTPKTAAQHLQGFLLGEAWRNYHTGKRSAALAVGMRSLMLSPGNRSVWRSVLVLVGRVVSGWMNR